MFPAVACAAPAKIAINSFGVHRLGATPASNALERVADCAKLQEWLGHANIATTRIYDHRRHRMAKLKLTVNDDKAHPCRIPQERFDFLGYTFGCCHCHKTDRAYLGKRPSKKGIRRMVDSISRETDRRMLLLSADQIVERLNRKLVGWAAGRLADVQRRLLSAAAYLPRPQATLARNRRISRRKSIWAFG
ncbi:hypothetical protein SB861_42535 [Paraburkholderia sp. SIMBA_049]